MGALTGKSKGEKGVRKDNYKGKVKPTLTPAERKRYENIFTIMKDVLSPKAEARDIAKTPAAAIGGTAQMQAVASKDKGDKKGLGIAGILGALALGAAGIGAAIATLLDNVQASFDEIVDGVLDFGSEIASDIGSLPAMALKLARFLPLKKLKFIPLLGPLINFGMSYKAFKDGNIVEGLWELTSGVAGLIPGVGTAISVGMDIVKMIYESTATTDGQGNKQSFGSWLGDVAKKVGSWLWEKVKAGNIPLFSAAYRLGESIGMMLTGDVSGGLKNLLLVLPNFFGISGDNLNSIIGMFDAFMGSETGQKVSAGLSKAGDFISDLFTKMGEGISEFFTNIKNWVSGKIDEGINAVKSFFGFGDDEDEVIYSERPLSAEGKQRLQELKRSNEEMRRRQEIARKANPEEFSRLYRKVTDLQLSTDEEARVRALNNFKAFVNANQGIEDGLIYNNGKVTRFDKQDDILAAKSGGPIDKMLNTNSKVMTELNAINQNQLNVLMQIRDGIRALSSNKSSNGPTDITFEPSTLTQEFYAV